MSIQEGFHREISLYESTLTIPPTSSVLMIYLAISVNPVMDSMLVVSLSGRSNTHPCADLHLTQSALTVYPAESVQFTGVTVNQL